MPTSRSNLLQKIFCWIEGPLRKGGYELYHLEDLRLHGNRVLRITIDHEAGIEIEDCVSADRIVQEILDEREPINDTYILEVSSPGIFRPLSLPKHFHKYNGHRIKIRLNKRIHGIRQTVGELRQSTEEGILFVPDPEDRAEIFINYQHISYANLEPELTYKTTEGYFERKFT